MHNFCPHNRPNLVLIGGITSKFRLVFNCLVCSSVFHNCLHVFHLFGIFYYYHFFFLSDSGSTHGKRDYTRRNIFQTKMLIGKRGNSNDASTKMAFGSLAIYERVLDDAQIARAYLAGKSIFKHCEG